MTVQQFMWEFLAIKLRECFDEGNSFVSQYEGMK
jgi:hypothetical protein